MTNPLISALGARPAFIAYALAARDDGKLDKVPVDPLTGRATDSQNPVAWMLAPDAQAAADALNLSPLTLIVEGVTLKVLHYGVGLVISKGCGLAFIDFDKCHDGSDWQQHVTAFEAWFPGAYRETSVSRGGRHIVCSYNGEIPAHKTKNADYRMECYTGGRFMALGDIDAEGSPLVDCTAALRRFLADYFPAKSEGGDSTEWTDAPAPDWKGPADDEELLRRAIAAKGSVAKIFKGAHFRDLHTDGPSTIEKHYHGDESSADQGYFNHLAFWTGKDCERMLRIAQREDCSLHRAKWDNRDDYLRRTILKACSDTKGVYRERDPKAMPVPTEDDPRPVILLEGGKLHEYAAEAERLLADSLYVHGGTLARIGRAAEISGDELKDAAGTKRNAAQAVCIPASSAWLRRALMERAQFWKFDKRTERPEPKDCPKELTDNIADQASWPSFRTLIAITGVPVLRPDLSVWRQPGYDHATQVFYQPTMAIPPILDAPTEADARAALARLREPFAEFPYASPEAEGVFLAHVVTAVIRASFDTSPVFLYTSPIAATGKTLLAQMPQLIATGVEPAQSPYTDGEELRKVLFASLLAGDSSLIFDNVGNGQKVRSAELCRFATSSTYADRVLGASQRRSLPNRCSVVLTGNNITPVSDLARRALPCRLDVNAESARGRRFRVTDLKGYVRERRAQLIVDALTIVRAYAFAGRPDVGVGALESFEEWSRLVRSPLLWLGVADPVASQDSETEDEVGPLAAAFQQIAVATLGCAHTFTASQLTGLLVPQAPTQAAMQTAHALREALVGAACKDPGEKIGYWLREHKDRVAGGWKLVSEFDKHTRAAIWRLRTV